MRLRWLAIAVMLLLPRPAGAQVASTATAAPPEDHGQSVGCLTLAVAYEAGHEPLAGQQAVAQVVLNRSRDPAFPATVCGVVFQGSTRRTGCQFTFTCDGSLQRRLSDATLAAARLVAEQAIAGTAPSVVAGATHYHAYYVRPYWAGALVRLTRIGAHIFYRGGAGSVGTPGALPVPPAAAAPAAPGAVFAPWGLVPAGLH